MHSPFPLVLVEWVDSATRSVDQWIDFEAAAREARELVCIQTVGFVINRTRRFVLLSQSHDDQKEPDVNGVFQIPVGCIRRVIKLRERPRKKRKPAAK